MKERFKVFLTYVIPTILLLGVACGQLIKITIIPGSRIGLTTLDLVLVGLGTIFITWVILNGQIIKYLKYLWAQPVWKYLLLFIGWALVSLLLNISKYRVDEALVSFSYWGRLALVFFVVSLVLYKDLLKQKIVINLFLIISGLLILLGYLQLYFLPNFGFMTKYGWDPHVGRMLSTFFDPNFFGLFIILVLSILFAKLNNTSGRKWYSLLFIFVSWFALYLTYSRSAWIAGLIALPIVVYPYKKWLSLLILLIFIGVLFIPGRLGSRFSGGLNDVDNQITGQTSLDQSADISTSARIKSIKNGWELTKRNWVIGVGYNSYGFASMREGLYDNDRALGYAGFGSDSTLLNIWATTGIIGLIFFLLFLGSIVRRLYVGWRINKNGIVVALFGFTFSWVIGSFLNNSLFYILVLLPWLILFATSINEDIPE